MATHTVISTEGGHTNVHKLDVFAWSFFHLDRYCIACGSRLGNRSPGSWDHHPLQTTHKKVHGIEI